MIGNVRTIVYNIPKAPETKNQWARDDPAFVVICSLLLAVATLAYCAAYDHSTAHTLLVIFSVLLFHFLLTGVFLATFCWFLTNGYLREEAPNSYVVEQRVECDPLFSISSIGGSWFHSSIAVKSAVHGWRFILSLSKFLRL
ncbi:hypothetical protein JHK84_056146 [Glycine max]|nr:hypothetical protein JHK84_056146 [Glycine max]